MSKAPQDQIRIAERYQPLARRAGVDARGIFEHPSVRSWRKLPDRENCTLDIDAGDGTSIRWHIKRFTGSGAERVPAVDEVRAHQLVIGEQIPTSNLVGWGQLEDSRSFVIFEDLPGYTPADKLLAGGFPFDRLLAATADLSARLHTRGLHHRDLYLCHFMVNPDGVGSKPDVRLIDTARVRALGGMFTRSRWIVKDLAQFWFSTLSLPVTDQQRNAWLERYGQERGLPSAANLRGPIERKVKHIARHDRKIKQLRPERDVSIPEPSRPA